MFTGIIEHTGRVEAIELAVDVARLRVDVGPLIEGVKLGDSIAVNGACLTVAEMEGPQICFEAVRETLEKTALGRLEAGEGVHLERAMRADGRFDGHIVQGHVDGVGHIGAMDRVGDDVRLHVDCDAAFADLLVDKGSVAIDGVSLTVVQVEPQGFHVVLIPHTLSQTLLGSREVGRSVNLEADVIGKYVKRYIDRLK